MDTAQWPQEIVVKPMEEIVTNTCPKPNSGGGGGGGERRARPQKDQALNCPRCNSTNTKFCYYNNYSLTQPRYFCKTCRRYWTEGGSLRNIPVGGGSRKNKRSSSSSSTTSNSSSSSTTTTNSSSKKLPDLVPPQQPPKIHHQGQDLNLAFPSAQDLNFRSITEFVQLQPNIENNNSSSSSTTSTTVATTGTTTTTTSTSQVSALELLTGITSSRGFSPFMPMSVTHPDPHTMFPTSGFLSHPLVQDFKPSLTFSLDGIGSGYGSLQGVQENSGRLLFPFEDIKPVSTNAADHIETNNRDQGGGGGGDSTGFWNGVLGGGPW